MWMSSSKLEKERRDTMKKRTFIIKVLRLIAINLLLLTLLVIAKKYDTLSLTKYNVLFLFYVSFPYKWKKLLIKSLISIYGVSGAIRTRDRTLRRRMLYPAELRGHISNEQINSIIFFNINQVLKSLKKKKLLILTVLTIYSL